jgi:hypothetical protein
VSGVSLLRCHHRTKEIIRDTHAGVKTLLARGKSGHEGDGRSLFATIKAREPSSTECQHARLDKSVLGHRVLKRKKNLIKNSAITLWRIGQDTKPWAPHLSVSSLHSHPDTTDGSFW